MVKVVLSYRRNDTKWITGRICEHLEDHFGAGNVFMDIDNIALGLDFRDQIRRNLAQCDVLIAVIGPKWLTSYESGEGALAEETDWVRIELSTALERKIPVVPLLIDGTKLPKANLLPNEIRDFAFRQAASFDTEDFKNQIQRLTRSLDRLIAETANKATPPPPPPPPARMYVAPDVESIIKEPRDKPVEVPPKKKIDAKVETTTPKQRSAALRFGVAGFLCISLAGVAKAADYPLGAVLMLFVLGLFIGTLSSFFFYEGAKYHEDRDLPESKPLKNQCYTSYPSPELGLEVGFPSNILALDNTKRKERVLFLRDGNGKVIVTISRKALDEKNVKIARETELASLRSDYSVTYIAPEKEENWSNWYVLSGVGHGTEFYYRRWLCPDSIVSIEFEYAKELAPQFNSLIPDMVRKLIISNCGK